MDFKARKMMIIFRLPLNILHQVEVCIFQFSICILLNLHAVAGSGCGCGCVCCGCSVGAKCAVLLRAEVAGGL